MKKSKFLFIVIIMVMFCVITMSKNIIFNDSSQSSNFQRDIKCSLESDNISLCTMSDKVLAKSGEEINLKLLVKNRGNKDVIISNQFPLEFEVFNEKGKIAQILSEQNKDNSKGFINRISVSHRYGITLKPQQYWETNVKLSEKYNLSKQGKYFVIIKAKLPDKNTIIELNLDKIEVNVR